MSKTLVYINIIATLLLLFAGFDQMLKIGILTDTGLIFVIFTAATFLLITVFLQLTLKKE
ncbi:MAG TPA: hypothetical protein VIH52_00245 [Candidatus Nanoarchaeia archaeon]|nr:hypothetical protein [uncultured archaeon]